MNDAVRLWWVEVAPWLVPLLAVIGGVLLALAIGSILFRD
jgi:hypothetical protein